LASSVFPSRRSVWAKSPGRFARRRRRRRPSLVGEVGRAKGRGVEQTGRAGRPFGGARPRSPPPAGRAAPALRRRNSPRPAHGLRTLIQDAAFFGSAEMKRAAPRWAGGGQDGGAGRDYFAGGARGAARRLEADYAASRRQMADLLAQCSTPRPFARPTSPTRRWPPTSPATGESPWRFAQTDRREGNTLDAKGKPSARSDARFLGAT